MFKKIPILILISSILCVYSAVAEGSNGAGLSKRQKMSLAKRWHKVYGYWKQNKALFYELKLQSKEIDTDIKILTRRAEVKCVTDRKVKRVYTKLISDHHRWLDEYQKIQDEQNEVLQKLYSFVSPDKKLWNSNDIRVGEERSIAKNFYALMETIVVNMSTVFSDTDEYVANSLYVDVGDEEVLPIQGLDSDIRDVAKSIKKFVILGKKWQKQLSVRKAELDDVAREVERQKYACADWNEYEDEEW